MNDKENTQGCPDNTDAESNHIKYWIIEMQFSDTALSKFRQLCEEAGLTMDEYFKRVLQYGIDHPEEMEQMIEEAQKEPPSEDDCADVKVIRIFPVYDSESEREAKERAIREEKRTGKTQPEVQ